MESRCEPAQEDVGCLLGVMLTLAGLPLQVASPDHAARACPESSRRGNQGAANQEQYLAWDAENRLVAVTYTNRTTAGGGGSPPPALCGGVPCKRVYFPLVMNQAPAERYSYDADGARVRRETKTEVTRYIGPHFEVTVGITNGQVLTTTKSYDFGGQRIAVRQNGTLSYLHGDHLGSTSVTTSASGAKTSDVRYFAYGGQRTGNLFALPTDHAFTGQKLDKGTGLLYYGARYYDSALGTFISPDTIVPRPGDPLSLNRHAYVLNNPLRYTDPTGHAWREDDSGGSWYWWESEQARQRPFSVHGIQPGGLYGYGEVPLGDRLVSVYLPPTVRSYATTDGLLPLYEPIYGLPMATAFVPRHQIADYWYGEEVPGRNAVAPNRWRSVASQRRVEGPSIWGLVAGIGRGLADTPEDLPLAPDATKAEVRANAAATGFSVLNGIAEAGWESNFMLQESVKGSNYRVIILTRPGYASEFLYATRVNMNPMTLTPIDWGPGPFLRTGR